MHGSTVDYMDQLHDSLLKASRNESSQVYLAGDFNLPDVDWPTQSLKPNARYANVSKRMLEIGAEFGLEQVVTKPTRKKNILDLFFTTNASLVQKSSILPGISDHDGIPVIVVNTKPQILTKKPHKTYNYSKANINAIKTELSNFSTYFTKKDNSSCSIDDMYSEFSNKIKSVMEDHVPSRLVHKKTSAPWIGRGIKRKHRRKQRAYNTWRKHPSNDTYENFQKHRKSTHRATRKAYREHVNSVVAESSKKFWSFMNSLKSDSIGIPSLKKASGDLESNNTKKAEILNDQFKEVFTKENTTLPPEPNCNYSTMPVD